MRSLYFEAVEAAPEYADHHFNMLLQELRFKEPTIDPDHAAEKVVANLLWVAGYYDRETQKRIGQLFSHYSPYRRTND
jgi:hypothetical protein